MAITACTLQNQQAKILAVVACGSLLSDPHLCDIGELRAA